ncbi:MAG: recombination protein O N-terminal domain-containing protein [Candidatus Paceibacterota bacterium]|jgi:DNA repair protein RecO (recombination protein O)
MHRIYTTDGYILGGKNVGEANRYYYILTRDLGLVIASAQSVRSHASKLKASLQDFSYSSISLVHGKNGWKITNASVYHSVFSNIQHNKPAMHVCANIFAVIKRLVVGEVIDAQLFNIVHDGMTFLLSLPNPSALEIRSIETILVARIIDVLGYVGDDTVIKQFLLKEWSTVLLGESIAHDSHMRSQINASLKVSDL